MFNPLTISHDEGLNVLSFERVKWGGVRLNWLVNCRDVVMEIWGYAGILESKDDYRKERGRSTYFMSKGTWRGEDGYSQEKMEYYFGPYL